MTYDTWKTTDPNDQWLGEEPMENEPKITRATISGMQVWRVDLPDGDFCYQPSESFAISYARRWQVAENMRHDAEYAMRNVK